MCWDFKTLSSSRCCRCIKESGGRDLWTREWRHHRRSRRCVKWGKWFSRFGSSPLWLATLLLSLALAALYSRWLKQNLKPSRATHPSLRAVTLLCLHPKWQLPQSPPQSHHPTVTGWDRWDLGPFSPFGVNDGWRRRPCSLFPLSGGGVISAASDRGHPSPSRLRGWWVNLGQRLTHIRLHLRDFWETLPLLRPAPPHTLFQAQFAVFWLPSRDPRHIV